jgi:integrase
VKERKGPITVIKVGEREVRVYPAPSKKGGREYAGFVADLRSSGLGRPSASTLEGLESKVRELVGPLVGECETLTLRRGPLRAYERAIKIAAELGLEVDEAMQRLRGIQQLAAAKGCVVERAIEYWARHHDQLKFNTPTSQVVDAFVDALKQNGNSGEDIATVKGKLNKFARAFGCPPCEISAEQYRVYFNGIPGSARNRMNHRNTARRFLNWAKDNGYLAIDHPGLPRFAGKVKVAPKRVEVFDIRQREQLIEQARPVERPMTLIKAYTPIRQKEAGVACWENIDWDVGIIMVWGEDAKTRRPRAIHLPRELCERLRPLAQPTGRIYPFKSFYKVGPCLARKAGLKWIRNGWRTTTISHLQAAINDKARVAEEAGTSVEKLESNYLKLLRPDVGRAYLGLRRGEHHPIEPGYNAEHYGTGTNDSAAATEEVTNVVTVEFGAHGG